MENRTTTIGNFDFNVCSKGVFKNDSNVNKCLMELVNHLKNMKNKHYYFNEYYMLFTKMIKRETTVFENQRIIGFIIFQLDSVKRQRNKEWIKVYKTLLNNLNDKYNSVEVIVY